jgi:hypothetical protein
MDSAINKMSGELLDLLSYLETGYRKEHDMPAGIAADSDRFIAWAKKLLANKRPVEVFSVNNNYGIMLSDGQRLKISPDAALAGAVAGTMSSSDSSISIFSK